MIIDAISLSSEEDFQTDICIVGAGPAGITLAREFINQPVRICLVESGGLEADPALQSLCEAKVIGDPYPDPKEVRGRQLGGTSHAWEAPAGYKVSGWRCLPLDEIDFEKRDWLPYSGWPFARSHLDPFYDRAHKVCQIGPYTYCPQYWEEASGFKCLPFKGDRVVTTLSQYASRIPFTQEYPEEIGRADNITTLLHGTIVEIETNETASRVTRLRGVCSGGRQFRISSKVFILATGGIENARLLLLSNRQQQAGLGNHHDLVGRFFMERPIVSCGMLIPFSRKLLGQTGLYDVLNVQNVQVMARVRLTDKVMRKEHLMNNGAQIFPRPTIRQKEATRSFRKLRRAIRDQEPLSDVTKHFSSLMYGGDYVAAAIFWGLIRRLPGLHRGDWSYLPYEKYRFSMFEVIYQIEQAPDPNNRIVLSDERDLLGLNKAVIHWRLNEIDRRTIKRVKKIWAEEFEKAGLGQLQLEPELKFDKLAMHHHMGTTRMHSESEQGVVDSNCKVHGVANLFIAGSSVFPTAGYSNPTLTIIALSLRLADHLKETFN